MSVECYKTYSYLNKLLHSIIMPVHWFSILDGSNLKWRATYYYRRFRQQIHHPVHSDIRQPFIGLYPFLIMKKPNKTASDLTACSIPTHAVMMHITKTSLENWKRKVIPEIFSTDNSNSFHISNWCQYTTNWCWYWWFQVFEFHTSPETYLTAWKIIRYIRQKRIKVTELYIWPLKWILTSRNYPVSSYRVTEKENLPSLCSESL